MSESVRVLLSVAAGCALIVVAWGTRSYGGDVTVREIVENPSQFDGITVSVNGKVRHLRQLISRKGQKYYTFDLSDGAEQIAVVVSADLPCAPDGTVTVHGRIEAVRRGSSTSGIVDATRIECH